MPPRSRIPRAASFKDLPKNKTDRTENQEIPENSNHDSHDSANRQTNTPNHTRQLRRGLNRPSPPAASSARTRTVRELSNTPSPDDGVKKTKNNSPASQIFALTRIPGPSARPTNANANHSSPLAVIDESDVDPDVTHGRAAAPNGTATSLARRGAPTANSAPSAPSSRGPAATRPLATRGRARAGTLSVTASEVRKSLLAADRTPAFLRLQRSPMPASPDSDGADADISNVMSVDSPTAPQQPSPSSSSSESSPPDSPTPASRSRGGNLWTAHDGSADDEAIEDGDRHQETNMSESANDADNDTSNWDLKNGNDTFAVESDHSHELSDASSDHLIPPRPNAPTPRSACGTTRDRRPRLVPMSVADMFDAAGETTAAVSVSGSASTATASSTPDKNPSSSPVTSPEQSTSGASGHATGTSSSGPDIEADQATDAEEILNRMIAELDQPPPRNRSRSQSTSVVPFRPQPSAFEAMRYAITPLPPTPDEIHELEARERDIRQAQVHDDDVVYESGSEKENSPPLVRAREHRPAPSIHPLGSLSHRSSHTHLNDMRARLASSTASTSTTPASPTATAAANRPPALVEPYIPKRLDHRQMFDELDPTPPKSIYDYDNGNTKELARRASTSSLSGVSGAKVSSSTSAANDVPAPATPQSSRKDKGKSKATDEKRERHAPGFDIYRDPPPKARIKETLAWGDGLWSFDRPEKVSPVEVSAYDVIHTRTPEPEPVPAPVVAEEPQPSVQVQDNTSLEWLHRQNPNLPYRDPAEYDDIYEDDDDERSNPRFTLFALTGIEMTTAPLANKDVGVVPLFIKSKSHVRSRSTSSVIFPATDDEETSLVPSRPTKHTFPEVTVEEDDEAALMHATLAAASARTVAEDKREFLKDYNGTLAGRIDMLEEQDTLLDETNELLARLRRIGDHGHWEAPLQTLIAAKKKRDRTRSVRNTTPPPSRDASDDEGDSEDDEDEEQLARPHTRFRTRSEGTREARYRDRPDSDRHIRLRLRSETVSTADTPSLSRSLGTGTSVTFSDITAIDSPFTSPTRPNNLRTLVKSRSSRSLGRVGANPPLTPLTPTSILNLPTECHRHTLASDHLPATPPGKRESNAHHIARLGVPLTPSATPSPERPGNFLRRGSSRRRRSPEDSVYDSPSPRGTTAGSRTSRDMTPASTGDTVPAAAILPPASLTRSNSARTAAVAAAAAEDQQRYRRWGRNRSDERAERVRLRDRLRRIVTPASHPAPPSQTVSPTVAAPALPPKEAPAPSPSEQALTEQSYWCDSDEEKR